MSCCSHCRDAGNFFNERTGHRELKRYLKKGPNGSTSLLLDGIRDLGVNGKTLLDIGSGVGVIHHELFNDGLQAATVVDASISYLKISEEEAERRGHKDRVSFYYGDFVDLALELPPSDFVTLDRVICCYPHMGKLVEASLKKSKIGCGMVFPRENWLIKSGAILGNLYFRMRGSDFRAYIHSPDNIREFCHQQGFVPYTSMKTLLWHLMVFVKN